jgi:hypothetical protein
VKKRMNETQAVTIDADQLPVGLHLTHADIAPSLTFICRRCGGTATQIERKFASKKRGVSSIRNSLLSIINRSLPNY